MVEPSVTAVIGDSLTFVFRFCSPAIFVQPTCRRQCFPSLMQRQNASSIILALRVSAAVTMPASRAFCSFASSFCNSPSSGNGASGGAGAGAGAGETAANPSSSSTQLFSSGITFLPLFRNAKRSHTNGPHNTDMKIQPLESAALRLLTRTKR